ncbi:hypothetical protein JCM11251_006543, partial [Rhodosporidiobolus azoricus]
ANVLLTQTGKILLCDFGVAAHLQANSKRSTFTGTPLWMAPEVITDGKMYDTKADIWSLGITLYEIIMGNPPYFGMEPLRACALIPRSEPPKLPAETEASSQMREFLASCLQVDPVHRPTADDLFKSRWIRSASKLPMVLLRELIVRYVGWIQGGGQRTSIIMPSSSSDEETSMREDTFELAGTGDDKWDFDVDEEDFGMSIGLGKAEGLGDEPTRAPQQPEPRTLDEKAAQGFARPPKQAPPPRANHPLLRLFDEASNPYAQPSFGTSQQTQIVLPSGPATNTVKATISIPSLDEIDLSAAASSSSTDFAFGGSSGFGNGYSYGGFGGGLGGDQFGGAGGYGGGAGGGGFGGAGLGASAMGFGGALAAADDLMSPATVRGNPFNWQQPKFGAAGPPNPSSSLSSSALGAPGSPFMPPSPAFGGSGGGFGGAAPGGFGGRETPDGYGWGGSGPASAIGHGSGSNSNGSGTASSNTPTESSFPASQLDMPPPFSTSTSTTSFGPSSSASGFYTQSPSLPSIATTAATPSAASPADAAFTDRPFGSGDNNRKRADTLPSQSHAGIGGAGAVPYPPLGAGLPRAAPSSQPYPPLGTGLPRRQDTADSSTSAGGGGGWERSHSTTPSASSLSLSTSGYLSPSGSASTNPSGDTPSPELYPNPIPNRPFGGLQGGKPFTFGGSAPAPAALQMQHGRERGQSSAADLGRPMGMRGLGMGMEGGMAGIGAGVTGKPRAGSDATGRRAGLKISTAIGIPSPSPPSAITTPHPASHSRQVSHSRTNSSGLSYSLNTSSPFSSSYLPPQQQLHQTSPRSQPSSTFQGGHRPRLSQSQTGPAAVRGKSSHLRTDSTASLLASPPSDELEHGRTAGSHGRTGAGHGSLGGIGDLPTPLAVPPAPLSADAALPTVTEASSAAASAVGGGGAGGGFPFPPVRLPSTAVSSTSTSPSPSRASPTPAAYSLPLVPPLNYAALQNPEKVQQELLNTLEGLGTWLEVVGEGLGRVVDGHVDIGVELGEGGGRGVAVV